MGSVFGSVRFLLPVCRLSWFLYTLNIYAHFSSHIFSNYWWQRSDIWSQASYWYPISWEAFLDPSDSYFLFADLVGFYTHLTLCTFFVTFFSATIDGRDLIFGHKLHIGTPYRGKRFLTLQIPTSCLPKSEGIISEHYLTVHLVLLVLNSVKPQIISWFRSPFKKNFIHELLDYIFLYMYM